MRSEPQRLKDDATAMERRSFLRLGLSGVAGAALSVPLSACGAAAEETATPRPAASAPAQRGRVLLAYFSRPGENYWDGGRRDLEVGNTEILSRLIRDRVDCDVFRIRPTDPYPDDYEETVQRNVREQEGDARPPIVRPPTSIDRYDTILLASPIWNVRTPMIMSTFAERYEFAGKTVHPIVTYAVSGLGGARDDYRELCEGARLGRALAVRGEEVRTRSAARQVDAWVRATKLRRG